MNYKALAAAALTVAAMGAWAQSDMSMATNNSYLEIGYMQLDVKGEGLEAKPSLVRINAGADVASNLAVEGILALSASEDSPTFNGQPTAASVKVNNMFGLYLKPHVNVTDNFEVFGRLGYINTKASISALGVNLSDKADGKSYGLGASLKLTKSASLTGDYMVYDDSDTNALTMGLRYNF